VIIERSIFSIHKKDQFVTLDQKPINYNFMTKEDYTTKTDDLFKRWLKERPEYKGEGKRFSIDGIMNFDNWIATNPKILFLLKENRADEDDWEPSDGINTQANRFSKNIARWTQVIREMYANPNAEPSFDDIVLPVAFNDIAIIEVKKLNEGNGQSSPADLKRYAREDKLFIQEQLEIINPEIIICGNTCELYGDIIYGDEEWERLIYFPHYACYKHRNRLVIDLYHPSQRANSKDREIFEILCRMIKEGNVFEKFNWYKSWTQKTNN
jgi:hypothetical protein